MSVLGAGFLARVREVLGTRFVYHYLIRSIMETIRGISARGITVLLIEQNVHMSLPMSHRAYVLENGRVVLEGPGEEMLRNPHVRVSYLGV